MVVDAADIIVPGRIVGINQRTRGGRLRAADKITACYLGGKYASQILAESAVDR